MQFKTFLLLNINIMFCNQYHLVIGNPLLGINVKEVEENELLFVVCLVEINNNITVEENVFCSGSLITNFHILTSEHCFDDDEIPPYRVLVGSKNLRQATPHNPEFWISFDQWSTQENKEILYPENDIAIVKLVENVNDIPVAQLSPVTNNELFYKKEVVVAGWGLIINKVLPTDLQKATLKIITNDRCQSLISRLKGEEVPVPEELYVCTKTVPYIHLGDGDSGGPVMYENCLIAVSKSLCPDINFNKNQVNVHVSINFYREFITENTNT